MNCKRLEDNIIQTVKEGQMKLGYDPAAVKINYRIPSLERFLETSWENDGQMKKEMEAFFANAQDRLGKIDILYGQNGMACLTIPKEGTEYIHNTVPDDPFLMEFFNLLKQYGTAKEDFIRLFQKYGDPVYEEGDGVEYDFVLYFANKKEDRNRYCIKFDFGRATYHRLSPEDFAAMTDRP